MTFVKGLLIEEYNKLLEKKYVHENTLLNNDIDSERGTKIKNTISGVNEDILFIENAFKGNGLNIYEELLIEKAKESLDSIDLSSVTICSAKECLMHNKCYRFAVYEVLDKKNIADHTATLFEHENCTNFIPLIGWEFQV